MDDERLNTLVLLEEEMTGVAKEKEEVKEKTIRKVS